MARLAGVEPARYFRVQLFWPEVKDLPRGHQYFCVWPPHRIIVSHPHRLGASVTLSILASTYWQRSLTQLHL